MKQKTTIQILSEMVNENINLMMAGDKNNLSESVMKTSGNLIFIKIKEINGKLLIGVGNSGSNKSGYIKWQESVGRYIFIPLCMSVYDYECMNSIAEFLKELE